MQTTQRRRPERGQAVPDREFPDGIEGFNYDWYTIRRKQPTRRRLPVSHWASFALILAGLCLATYADLGPYEYRQRAEHLLRSGGLEWVAGKVMSVEELIDQARGTVMTMLANQGGAA